MTYGDGADIRVTEGVELDVGRGKALRIQCNAVSRHHCTLYWKQKPVLQVTAAGKKPVFIQNAGSAPEAVQAGASGQLHPGGTLYLLPPSTPQTLAYMWPHPGADQSPITPTQRRAATLLPLQTQACRHEHASIDVCNQDAARTSDTIFAECTAFFAIHKHTQVLQKRFQVGSALLCLCSMNSKSMRPLVTLCRCAVRV